MPIYANDSFILFSVICVYNVRGEDSSLITIVQQKLTNRWIFPLESNLNFISR